MKKNHLKLFYFNQKQLFSFLLKELQKYYNNIEYMQDNYIYVVGNIPILLVSHLDTVFTKKISNIQFNKKDRYYFSDNGLGADDRAGVTMILNCLENGFLPSILFCCDEEIGAIGANSFIKTNDKTVLKDINIIIELDRQGYNEYTTYTCDNPALNKYAESFELKKVSGTFSDIYDLCPFYEIGGINMSVGYCSQHTKKEKLYIDDYNDMLLVVFNILSCPPSEKIEYIKEEYTYVNSYCLTDYWKNKSNFNKYSTATTSEYSINFDMCEILDSDYLETDNSYSELFNFIENNYDEVMTHAKKSAIMAIIKLKREHDQAKYNIQEFDQHSLK